MRWPDLKLNINRVNHDNEKSLEAALAAGSPHFGDIMGRGEGHRGGQEGSLLRHFDAMERVVLTANGNLQRVIRLASSNGVDILSYRPIAF